MADRDPLTDRVNALAARYRERALNRVPPDFNEPESTFQADFNAFAEEARKGRIEGLQVLAVHPSDADLLAVLDEEGEEE